MDSNLRSILLATALNNFKTLELEIESLMTFLTNSNKEQIYVPNLEIDDQKFLFSPRNEKDQINLAISDLWYRSNEKGVSTRQYKGIVLASKELIDKAKRVNQAKDNFALSIREIRDLSEKELKKFKMQLREFSSTRDELTAMGMKRINLNHCYRHIHLFEHQPVKIQYSQSSHEISIKKITKNQALKMLENISQGQDSTHIEIQKNKLNALKGNTPLAIVRNIAPHFKVNLFYHPSGNPDGKLLPVTRKPGLPLFILDEGKDTSIRFDKKNSRGENSKIRSDKILEPEPFLPSISAHLYKSLF